MKELLKSIIQTEGELQSRSQETEQKLKGIRSQAAQKAADLDKEFQDKFSHEKADKTKIVEDLVKEYDQDLRRKFQNESDATRVKLNKKKNEIIANIVKGILY
jgi:hypothetical protein